MAIVECIHDRGKLLPQAILSEPELPATRPPVTANAAPSSPASSFPSLSLFPLMRGSSFELALSSFAPTSPSRHDPSSTKPSWGGVDSTRESMTRCDDAQVLMNLTRCGFHLMSALEVTSRRYSHRHPCPPSRPPHACISSQQLASE